MRVKKNVGGLDRKLRIIGGMALLAAAVFLTRGRVLIAATGLAMLTIGLAGFCPLYVPFGISTRKGGDDRVPLRPE